MKDDTPPTVHVVHCIDTEGPLHESLQATFRRLRHAFGVDLDATEDNLRLVREQKLDLSGWEGAAARMVSPQQLNYLNTWAKLEKIMDQIFDPAFRQRFRDSFGQGWICNWFCMDHVGFESNPRRRDLGYHHIFDRYRARLADNAALGDSLAFHFHPVPFSRKANHRSTNFFGNADTLFQVLSRRIIDRHWFPCANRPGFNATRPDSHWFLEQHIPFDFANQAWKHPDRSQPDRTTGRFVDWRRAPMHWTPYHPDKDDYQTEGSCRRWVARCLNIGARARTLTQTDVDEAFAQAGQGKSVVLSFANHDHRDIRPDIHAVHAMLADAAARHSGVSFRFCTARQAFQRAMRLKNMNSAAVFNLSWQGTVLHIETDQPIFGPQPYLALKSTQGEYFTDNLDFQKPFCSWSYTFDRESLPLESLEAVGLAASTPAGNTTVAVACPPGGNWTQTTIRT